MKHRQPAYSSASGFRRGVFFSSSGTTINIAFLFLETVIAVRLLSADSYGGYVLVVALANFLVVAVDFGCKTTAAQFISSVEPPEQESVASTALSLRLTVLVVISGLIWLSQDLVGLFVESGVGMHYARLVPLMLVVASVDELLYGLLQGFQLYMHMAISQIVRSVLRLGLTVFFLSVLELGVSSLIYSWCISFAVSAAYQYLALPIRRRLGYDPSVLRRMLRFGAPLQVTRFLWFALRQADVLLLGVMLGPVGVASYSVAARIPDALQRLSESYIAVYFPTIASLLAKGRRQEAGWFLNSSMRLLSLAAASLALVAVLFSQEITLLVFSSKYESSSFTFSLLMLALHMGFLVNIMGYTLTSAGFPGRSLAENATRTTMHIVGDLLLIPAFGFVGPAYSALLSRYAANPLALWLLRRSDVDVLAGPYVKQTVILLLCCGLYWWAGPVSYLYRTGLVIVYVAINLALSTISREDLSLVLPGSRMTAVRVTEGSVPFGR